MSPKKSINNQKNKILTVVICSNCIKKIEKYTIPSALRINSFCQILIILDSQIKNIDLKFVNKLNTYKNVSVVVCPRSGLSNLRNFALDSCDTKFILFIDDDVTMGYNSIKAIEVALNNGNDIVGLKLSPPDPNYVKRWFFTQNQYHYIGLHAISNNTSIWGACMAFNFGVIKKTKLHFRSSLDRQNNKLLSGGDTTFIGELKDKGAKAKLITDYSAIHYVDNARLNLFTFSRRVFWQGITESVRCNIKFGIIKELKRNFQIINIKSLLIGTAWFFVFLLGVGCGLFYRKNICDSTQKKKILFLCTGNYYRSKFAEIYFNYFATKNNLNWEAFSRGFHVQNPDNIGWISQLALEKLKDLNIPVMEGEPPRSIALVDLKQSDILIVLNEKEHCPFVKKFFSGWEDKFIYWHIFDRQEVAPELALLELQKNIDLLISNLNWNNYGYKYYSDCCDI